MLLFPYLNFFLVFSIRRVDYNRIAALNTASDDVRN